MYFHLFYSSCPLRARFEVLDKALEEGCLSFEYTKRSKQAFLKAASFASQSGQGRSGWLWMLAAIDLDKSNIEAVFNLIENYRQLSNGPPTLNLCLPI